MTREEQLGALGAEWDLKEQLLTQASGEVTRLTEAVEDISAELTAERVKVSDLTNKLVTAEAEVKRLTDLYEPKPTFLLGYCPDPNTPTEVARLGALSGATVRRSYKGPGAFPSNPTFAGDAAAGLRTAHTIKGPVPSGVSSSMKTRLEALMSGRYDAEYRAYVAKSAKDSILGIEHEPEDDFRDGRWDKKLYRDGQSYFKRNVLDPVNAADGGNRLFAGNMMSSTSETELMQFYPGDGVWDVLGFDGYNWPNRTPGATTVPRWVEFEEIFTPDAAIASKLGLKFAIFEYGCRKAHLLNDASNDLLPTPEMSARQMEWHTKARPVLAKLQPVVACYFHHDWWLMREEGHLAMGGKV
jgi:hypothetical protein